MVCGTAFFINFIAMYYHASRAIPFGTMVSPPLWFKNLPPTPLGGKNPRGRGLCVGREMQHVLFASPCPGRRLLHLLLCHSATEPRGNHPGEESVRPAELPLPSERCAETHSREEVVSGARVWSSDAASLLTRSLGISAHPCRGQRRVSPLVNCVCWRVTPTRM